MVLFFSIGICAGIHHYYISIWPICNPKLAAIQYVVITTLLSFQLH